jgi:hypothetical protein
MTALVCQRASVGQARTMKKPRDYCFRHAQMYEGWQCPLCLEEAPEDPSAAGRDAPVPAAAPTQPGSRGESQAKTAQAEGLLLSGSPREALDLAETAIACDPKNLRAYVVGARASRALRDAASEEELMERAVKLLPTDEYAKTSSAYFDVLTYLRHNRQVGPLVRAFVEAKTWPPAESLALVKLLVARGASADALVVLDTLPEASRSLLTCAYNIQLSRGVIGSADPELASYLQAVPAAERGRVLSEFREVAASTILSGGTVGEVRDAIRGRYRQWAGDIRAAMGEEARKAAVARLDPQLYRPAIVSAVRFFVGALVLGSIVGVVGGPPGFLLGALVAVGAAGAGYAYGRDVELKRRLSVVLPEVREELTAEEVAQWAPVLEEPAGVPGGSGPRPSEAAEPCPYCGAPTASDASNCPQCRRILAPIADVPPDDPPDAAAPSQAEGGDV